MPTRSVPVSAISGGSRAAISSSAVERISSWVPLVSMVPPLAPPPSEAADPPSEAPEPPELPAPSEPPPAAARSEEHTSELQSRGQLVCRLLLEKKHQGVARGSALEHDGREAA